MRQIPYYVDGQSMDAATFDDVPSEEMNAIQSAGIQLSAGDLYQLAKAMAVYVAQADYYIDSGAADSYILSSIGSLQSPVQYSDGMRVRFVATNASTGNAPPTINVNDLGSKKIYRNDGSNIGAGDISSTQINELVFLEAYSGFTLISQSYAGQVFTTGDIKPTHKLTAESGWIMYTANGSIGNVGSGATIRANADTQNLFNLFWIYSAAVCPMQDGGGRGASAIADWENNRAIRIPQGSWGAAMATPSATYPVGTSTGTATVTLTNLQNGVHNHTASDYGHVHTDSGHTHGIPAGGNPASGQTCMIGSYTTSNYPASQTGNANIQTGYANISVANSVGGQAHNNMQPTYFCNWMVKL